jgi:hypothetical protein
MTYLSDYAARGAVSTPKPSRGLFGRLREALRLARQDEMDEVAIRYLQTHGGVLTDLAERESERRMQSDTFQ